MKKLFGYLLMIFNLPMGFVALLITFGIIFRFKEAYKGMEEKEMHLAAGTDLRDIYVGIRKKYALLIFFLGVTFWTFISFFIF